MTAEASWAAAGLARAVDQVDLSVPILDLLRARSARGFEPLLIDDCGEAGLPELHLP